MNKNTISKGIFREYDIRGIINETLFEETSYLIGSGFCSLNKNIRNIIVCRDGRLSSPKISNALINGILETGVNVIDIGCGPTPMLYFASNFLDLDAGIMVTGSHNPVNHNGFKIILNNKSFYGENIQSLYKFIIKNVFKRGKGVLKRKFINDEYINNMLENSGPFPDMKVIWDCGNGATGEIISKLIKRIPGEHTVLFSEINGKFPNHHPDPSVKKNLEKLISVMETKDADLGIAFDGDGDRIGIVSKEKELISGDILTSFLTGSVINNYKNNKIILDIKSSYAAIEAINSQGGETIISKTGHSIIKSKLQEIDSPLAGEVSGHIFFNDKWHGVDDGPYSALRVLEEIYRRKSNLDKFLNDLPKYYPSPEIRIVCEERQKFNILDKIKIKVLKDYNSFNVKTIDGVRVSLKEGWWLIRASNTEPAIIVRAEGTSRKNLEKLIKIIAKYLKGSKIIWDFQEYINVE